MSDALNLTQSWVMSGGYLVNPATCGAGDCDSCDGDPCEHDCHAMTELGNRIWKAFESSGHIGHGGWECGASGVVRCVCGEVFLRVEEDA